MFRSLPIISIRTAGRGTLLWCVRRNTRNIRPSTSSVRFGVRFWYLDFVEMLTVFWVKMEDCAMVGLDTPKIVADPCDAVWSVTGCRERVDDLETVFNVHLIDGCGRCGTASQSLLSRHSKPCAPVCPARVFQKTRAFCHSQDLLRGFRNYKWMRAKACRLCL